MSLDKNKLKQTAWGGIVQNPTFVLVLGMCPTIAVSTSLINALGMGAATIIVLTLSNIIVSLCRKAVPDNVRIPAYILIIATLTTIIDLAMKRFTPELSESLGVFIPLIVVNCIIFARAEAFASKNSVGYAAVDGLSMGIGFTLALSLLGLCRELLAYGSISFSGEHTGEFIPIFAKPAGGFLMLAILLAAFNTVYKKVTQVQKEKARAAKLTQPLPQNASKEAV